MSLLIAQILFASAVTGLIVLVAAGTLFSFVTLIGRWIADGPARYAATELSEVSHHPDRAFHHPDKIQTSLLESVFMAVATAVVLVGLPVALGLIFHFVLPLVGESWVH
jgi:hypothetical protein